MRHRRPPRSPPLSVDQQRNPKYRPGDLRLARAASSTLVQRQSSPTEHPRRDGATQSRSRYCVVVLSRARTDHNALAIVMSPLTILGAVIRPEIGDGKRADPHPTESSRGSRRLSDEIRELQNRSWSRRNQTPQRVCGCANPQRRCGCWQVGARSAWLVRIASRG